MEPGTLGLEGRDLTTAPTPPPIRVICKIVLSNRNIRRSVVRSSILWRYSVVVGSVLNETADGCSFLRASFLEQRLER